MKISFHSKGFLSFLSVLLVLVTILLAIPFLINESISWFEMNSLIFSGTLFLTIAIFLHGSVTVSCKNVVSFFLIVVGMAFIAEYVGTKWSLIFGEYTYHRHLLPKIMGVPCFIPMAWFVIAYGPLVFLRSFSVRKGKRGWIRSLIVKSSLSAIYLTAVDFLLDPLATSVSAWTWQSGGIYFGIPMGNYFGWLLVGFMIYTLYYLLEEPKQDSRASIFFYDLGFLAVQIVFTVLAVVGLVKHFKSMAPILPALVIIGPYWIYWISTHYKFVNKLIFRRGADCLLQ